MPIWQSELGWTSSYISSVGAVVLLVFAIIAPFAGRLVDRQGPRSILNLGMGMISAGHAIGGAMGAYADGYVFDTIGGYDLLWLDSL